MFHYKKDNPAYSIKPDNHATKHLYVASADNRMCFLYVIKICKWQGLENLKFTSADPDFIQEKIKRVYSVLPATLTAEELQETRVWSWELVAYVSAMLPAAPYFKASDTRIACICDDKYTTTLEMLK